MRHRNSVLHGVLKPVARAEFDRLVEEHGADAGVRKLSTRAQFVALLCAQLAGVTALREIETATSATAPIAYLLLRLVQEACKITVSPLTFARLLRANIMHLRPLGQFLKPPPNRALDPRQLTLNLATA